MVIDCPHCSAPTELSADPGPPAASPTPASTATTASPGNASTEPLTPEDLAGVFTGKVPKTPVSILYQLSLGVVGITMVILPLIYFALIAVAAFIVYFWATSATDLVTGGRSGRINIFLILLYFTPLIAGIVVVFFMIKPLLARRPSHAQPLALNRQSEPVLFAYISQICAVVGSPQPTRIDIDCNLNASASFRRGLFSLLGNDLVLTIGLPLVAGYNTRQLAGVIAHEFGHFTQGFGMRLSYLIRRINGWFARVVYERDAWDLALDEFLESAEDWRVLLMAGIIRFAVGCSRFILKLLMWIGHGIGCFMLRQMEYDADSYEIKLAGSATFEDATRRFHVLAKVTDIAYKDMRVGWNTGRTLPDNFPAWLMYHDHRLDPKRRTQLEDTMGLEASGMFDTHPSHGDRIRRARQAQQPGVFQLETPATRLFGNFEAVSKQVTHLHYTDDLGIPGETFKLAPIPSETESKVEDPPPLPQPESTADAGKSGLRLRVRPKGHS
jgi:Zn-dependent protease with chaperone function